MILRDTTLDQGVRMTKNMGVLDRGLRISAALIVIALYLTGRITGTLAIVLLVFATIFILTSFLSFCPLYTLLGISTGKKPTV
jgi:hypothetical protein